MNRLLLIFIIYFHAGLLWASALVDSNIYQIEIIVFEHKHKQRFYAEKWPKHVKPLERKNAVNIQFANPLAIAKAKNDLLLKEQAKLIKRTRGEKIIFHTAWEQEILPHGKVRKILLQGGKLKASPVGEENVWELEGIISIRLLRDLFHTNARLQLNKFNIVGEDLLTFELQESAKMRHRELYYFDHPIYGAVMAIHQLAPSASKKTEGVS